MFINLGNNIRYFREKYSMTQEQLGKLVCVTKVSISCYENNKRKPSLETIICLSKIFNITVDDLINYRQYKTSF